MNRLSRKTCCTAIVVLAALITTACGFLFAPKNDSIIIDQVTPISFVYGTKEPIENKITPIDNVYLDEVMQKEEYNYLPEEAKQLIKENYEETGILINTEVNKTVGVPYLNPEYVEYLELPDQEKQSRTIIPKTYSIDYMEGELKGEEETLPSRFTLENVDGKKYITDLRSQDELGICWAFSSLEQIESYMMMNDESFYSSPTVLSTRQLDYVTSKNGITNFSNNPNVLGLTDLAGNDYTRVLGEGGNYTIAEIALMHGASAVNESFAPWNTLTWKNNTLGTRYPMKKVIDYNKSLYEVDNTIEIPVLNISELDLTKETDIAKKDNYLNTIKSAIKNYGGAYIGTEAPTYTCSAKNPDDMYVIRDDGKCVNDAGHAMQVIGWDDDYEYSYKICNGTGKYAGEKVHVATTNSCTGETVHGTGVWIVRNSWGTDSQANFTLVAYDSDQTNFALSTKILKMSDRNWDNVYTNEMNNYIAREESKDIVLKSREQIQKVKFITSSEFTKFNVSLYSVKNNNQTLLSTIAVDTTYPGVYTADFSEKNISLEDTTLRVKIIANKLSGRFYMNSISTFTKNLTTDKFIDIEKDAISINEASLSSNVNDKYEMVLYTTTKNIETLQSISYTLKTLNGEDITDTYIHKITDNDVSANAANTIIQIKATIPKGIYKINANYMNAAQDNIYVSFGNSTIGYSAGAGGTISCTSSELVHPFLGTAIGCTAVPNSGYKFKNWTNSKNTVVSTAANFIPTKTADGYYVSEQYKANFEELKPFTVQSYNVDSSNTIKGIATSTSVQAFKNKFTLADGYDVKIYKNGNEVTSFTAMVGTGMVAKVAKSDGTIYTTMEILIKGDTDGDGVITAMDLLVIKKHLLKKSTLTGVYEKAAFLNPGGTKISAMDLLRLKRHLLKIELITQE